MTEKDRKLAERLPPWFLALDTQGAGQVSLKQWRDAGYDPSGMAVPAPPIIPLTAAEKEAFQQAVSGLPKGKDLVARIFLNRLNEERAATGGGLLESIDDIDPNQPWVEAGKDVVILQMLKDFPEDAAKFLRRAGLTHLQIESEPFRFKTDYELKATERTIVLDETSRNWPFRRPKTVKEAAVSLHKALLAYTSSNAVARGLSKLARDLTSNVRRGFEMAGLTDELKDYEALFEQFEADLSYATNATLDVIKLEGKSQAFGAVAGVGLGAMARVITKRAKALGKFAPKNVPNPYGKLGSPAHRAMVDKVAADIEARGLIAEREVAIRRPRF